MSGQDGRRHSMGLYLTGDQPCSYLPARQARSLFIDPLAAIDGPRYQWLLEQGFRRSGRFVYRPACRGCRACVPVRIPVADFIPDRAQRRNRRQNEDIDVRLRAPTFVREHFALYQAYLAARHPDGTMADDDEASYRRFLLEPWGGETRLMELRRGSELIAVAVTDVLPRALSAVYTFFDPAAADRGPGTCAILRQIAEAYRRGLDHLYLGYWIAACRKMRYKERFRPLETWDGHSWQRCQPADPLAGHAQAERPSSAVHCPTRRSE